MKLISRQRLLPGSQFYFREPAINWEAPKNVSFETVVSALIAARNANPYKKAHHKWSTDHDTVAQEVEDYNCRIALANGWEGFVAGGGGDPIPFPQTPQPSLQKLRSAVVAVKRVSEGARVLIDWETSGDAPVAQGVANKRAAICATCPQNDAAPLTDWFTVPAAELIKKRIKRLHELKLATPSDPKIHTCRACLCPLALKVWAPMKHIQAHLADDVKKDLDPGCWVLKELA